MRENAAIGRTLSRSDRFEDQTRSVARTKSPRPRFKTLFAFRTKHFRNFRLKSHEAFDSNSLRKIGEMPAQNSYYRANHPCCALANLPGSDSRSPSSDIACLYARSAFLAFPAFK